MRRALCVSLLLSILGCDVLGCDGGVARLDAGEPSDAWETLDADGDSVSDADELRGEHLDTDRDGIEDWRDEDSDGDGLPDRVEAGDDRLDTPPVDADRDGRPDLRDTDSDDNGYPDAVDGTGDLDGDGEADYRDLDDDADFVRDRDELAGLLYPPIDSDGDGAPNFRDPDSDGDGILDGDEFGLDTDGDALFDHEDHDSDDDGYPDAEEAGDADLYSPPVDTDGDGLADFRDLDSDGDGLSDARERALGFDPRNPDTDGDGLPDLLEVDREDPGPDREAIFFVVPFEEAPTPPRATLSFRSVLQRVDVYFLFDASDSLDPEIDALRGAVASVIGDLTCSGSGAVCSLDSDCAGGEVCSLDDECIENPAESRCVASLWTGVGAYGYRLENRLSIQPDPDRTAGALVFGPGGSQEHLNGAVWGVADPLGAPAEELGCAAPRAGFLGCPAFRADAARVLVTLTDEDNDGPETTADAANALRVAGITFLGLWSDFPTSPEREDLVALARESGSLDRHGAPLVFDADRAGVVPAVTRAIEERVGGVSFRVTVEASDQPGDAGDALAFLDHVEVNTAGDGCSLVRPVEDTDADGHPDAFPRVLPGTPLCWDVVPRENRSVSPTDAPQLFHARITISGDGSPLDARDVYFLVPARRDGPGGPM